MKYHSIYFSLGSIQLSCSAVSNSLRPHESLQPGLPLHHQLPEFMQTHVHWVGDAIQPSHPLSSPSPDPNPSQHQSLFNESTPRMRWPKYWSFSFSISPFKEHPGLISFRMDWLNPCSPRDSQESSPTPQFKSINSLLLWYNVSVQFSRSVVSDSLQPHES